MALDNSVVPPEDEQEKVGFLVLLTMECFSVSSVVSCIAATHVFIRSSLVVWKRCSEEGEMTWTGENGK